MTIQVNDIKKGTKVKTNHLGVIVTAIMLDSQRRNTRLVSVNASDIGGFDEAGSIYAWNIKSAKIDDEWVKVELSDSQKTAQKRVEALGF